MWRMEARVEVQCSWRVPVAAVSAGITEGRVRCGVVDRQPRREKVMG